MRRTLSERWAQVRGQLTLQDLCLDVLGKVLIGVGLGALLATTLRPLAWTLIGAGIVLALVVKAKYWKRFWS